MKKETKVPFFIQSKYGHGTEQEEIINIEQGEVQNKVEEELEKGNFVTIEKEEGTELLVKDDIPKLKSSTTKELDLSKAEITEEENWANKFKNVKSTIISKGAKGG